MENRDLQPTDDTVLRKAGGEDSSGEPVAPAQEDSDASKGQLGSTRSQPARSDAGRPGGETDRPELRPSESDEFALEHAKTVIRRGGDSDKVSPDRTGRTPAEIASVLVGEQLNQYFLEAMIGGGGMGAVFRAHDQRLDRIVALKVIPFVGNDPELQRRFRNEAQNAAKLDHPRIARVFDAGDFDDWHYIVFEYIKGTNIRDLVDDHGPLSLDDAVVFTSQVAEALDHASQRGIVHRDIKPSNILVSDSGTTKLVDMGLARSDGLDLSEDMTASGVTLGTFDYISPEQAFDPRDADIRSDLYSLGCTFYFMVTGEAPYTGGTMLQKLISHGNSPPPDPRKLRPDLPDEAVAIMHRMMAKDPKARYQNAGDLLADLSELAYRYGLKRAQSNTIVPPLQPNDGLQRLQMHLPWMIAVLLILMVGGYLELQSTATHEAFVIDRPTSTSRADLSQSRSTQIEIDRGAGPIAPFGPGGEVLGNDSRAPVANDDSVQETPAIGMERAPRPLNGEDPADAAARPPTFDLRLPPPSSVEPGRSDSGTAVEEIGRESGDLDGEEAAMTAVTSEPGSADPTASDAAGLSTGAVRSDSVQTGSVAVLPPPQAVRVVAPSLLALALRVDQVDRDTDGAILVPSLAEALDLAMRFGVSRVEIAVSELVTGPLTIPQDNMVIESTVGRSSIRMVPNNTLAIGRSEMLTIGNNRTQFKHLDFHWELPPEQVDGGSMFVINDNRLTRFQDCTFTLVNRRVYDGVTFFQIVTDPDALPDSETLPGRIFNPNKDALPLVALKFDDVIVRGEASLIRMDYAAALQMVWDNGLISISGRMIETAGALRRPTLVASPIQISLSDVTAEIPLGLVRMRLDGAGIYPVPIERDAHQCVFLVDEGQPYVELIGVDSLSSDRPFLTLRGEDNAYVGSPTLSDPLLYMSDIEGNESTNTMSELASESLTWVDERRPRWNVRWSTARQRGQVYYRQTPANYRQDGAIFFGFRELELPPLP